MLTRIARKLISKLRAWLPEGSLSKRVARRLYAFAKATYHKLDSLQGVVYGHCRRLIRKASSISRSGSIQRGSKLLFVDHSYHAKTKSSKFMVDLLSKHFEVEVIFDESWDGGEPIDFSRVKGKYAAIVFWQYIPDSSVVKLLGGENIIYFPMYDSCGSLGYSYWKNLADTKVVCFSKTLHKKISRWGIDSIYTQYFPEPERHYPGARERVFFWQRVTRININTLSEVFGDRDVKLHVHRAIDPGNEFVQPSRDIEKKYNITYSDYFETPEEMREKIGSVIRQSAFYVAPREYEGIGMSFLEAMATGKAVIAVNNPTMNEYIIHNKTGYLFDLANPQPINLDEVEKIQENTYNYMVAGYKRWLKKQDQIIDFVNR